MSRLGRALRGETRDIGPQDLPFLESMSLGGMSTSGVSVSTTTAFRHADVYACVRVISDAGATIPLKSYKDTDTGRNIIPATPGSTASLLRQPAPGVSQANLIASTLAHLNLSGEAFWLKFRDPSERISQLGILRPSRVESIDLENGEPVYRVVAGDGSTIAGRFTRRDILHIRGMTLDGVRGVSPIGQARDGIGVGMALEEAAGRDFANGAYPGGVIQMKGQVSDTALKRFRKSWNGIHRGAKNRGRVAFLEDGWEYKPLGMPARDAQFVEQRKLSATQIARIFRVPPYMIGADSGGSMTYSTVEGEMTAFLMHTVRPWLAFIEQALASDPDFYDPLSGEYPEFLMDAFLRADTQVRYLAYQQADFMSINEKRRRENLEDREGGDVIPAIERIKTQAASAAAKGVTRAD